MLDRRRFIRLALAAVIGVPSVAVARRGGDHAVPKDDRRNRLFLVRGAGGVWGLSPDPAAAQGTLARSGGVAGIAIGLRQGRGAFVAGREAVGVEFRE